MGIKSSDIIAEIEKSYPRSLAMSWDNPGLICGHYDKEINKVLIALDADNHTVDKALESGVDMILTHHPMIFGSIKQINDADFLGRKLLKLIENGICCYAMHTNFDIASEGMGDIVAEKLGIASLSPLEKTYEQEGEKSLGIGFIGDLAEAMTVKELSLLVKEKFKLSSAWFYDAGRTVKRIAVCPGSGKGMMDEVKASGADVFITGDTGHHDGLDYIDAGISLIDAGHFGLEHIFADKMNNFLAAGFPTLETALEVTDERQFI